MGGIVLTAPNLALPVLRDRPFPAVLGPNDTR